MAGIAISGESGSGHDCGTGMYRACQGAAVLWLLRLRVLQLCLRAWRAGAAYGAGSRLESPWSVVGEVPVGGVRSMEVHHAADASD